MEDFTPIIPDEFADGGGFSHFSLQVKTIRGDPEKAILSLNK